MKNLTKSLAALAASGLFLAGCLANVTGDGDRRWSGTPKPDQADQYSDFLIARFASLTNDPILAAETYERAALRDPQDPVILERAVFSLLLARRFDEAADLIDRLDPADEDLASLTRLTRGVEDMSKGRYRRSRTQLTQGDMGPFNKVIATSVAAWAAFGDDDPEGAQTLILSNLVGDDILDGVSLYMMALVQMSAGDDAEALATFDALWTERMRLAVAAEHYARLLAANDRRDDAIDILNGFRDEVGPNPAVELLLRQLEAGEEPEPLRLDPKVGAALSVYAMAAALAAETQDDLAGVYFTLALELDPTLDVARTLLGNSLDLAERHEEALSVLENVGPDSPFYATARGQMAWVLRRMERNDAALETARQALSASPDRDLKVQLGDLYRSLEQYEEAERRFDEVVREDAAAGKPDWRTLYARAVVRAELDRWDEAEADLKAALDLEPNQPQVLNYLGYTWVDRGENLDDAFAMIRKAVNLRPQSGYIVDSLGWAHYKLGNFDEAVRYLERAVELAPEDPVLNDHLGDAYWKVGRKLEAGFQWRHALDLEPEEADALRIQAKRENGLDAAPATALAADGAPADIAQP